MPNIKSQIKSTRKNNQRRDRRVAQKSALRTAIKNVELAVAANDVDTAKEAYKSAARMLEKAATKGIVHKNEAARRKARLSQKINSVTA